MPSKDNQTPIRAQKAHTISHRFMKEIRCVCIGSFCTGDEPRPGLARGLNCLFLFLTARVEEQDRVNGLLSGGDDYILKPFSLKELEARIIAHLKREERHRAKSKYRFFGELSIDYSAKAVQVGEKCLDLTKLEYGIIEFLSMNPGVVFDRERIYERVCGYDAEGDSRIVTELVRRIRKKIGELSETEYIETVWGMGYRWKNGE